MNTCPVTFRGVISILAIFSIVGVLQQVKEGGQKAG